MYVLFQFFFIFTLVIVMSADRTSGADVESSYRHVLLSYLFYSAFVIFIKLQTVPCFLVQLLLL